MAAEKVILREFEVLNKYGIHARPAALLVKAAGKFTCDFSSVKKARKSPPRASWGC
jgi:phosphotransferase system HPr (HPr) family protein